MYDGLLIAPLLLAIPLSEAPPMQSVQQIDLTQDAVAVGPRAPWKESETVRVSHTAKCSDFVVTFEAMITKDGIEIERIDLNSTDVGRAVRDEVEAEVNKMGGFDYPYVLCTSDSILLAFDRKMDPRQKVSYGKELN